MLPKHVRLVLVGDPHQLMPVGPGLVLHTLSAVPEVPGVELKTVKRYGGAIAAAAADIRAGRWPTLTDDETADVAFLPCAPGLIGETVTELLALDRANSQVLCALRNGRAGTKLLNHTAIRSDCEDYKKKINVKTPSLEQKIMNLSGGNQQKVLVARWLLSEPDILILDEPTRGIDVGAKAEIHTLITNLAAKGKAIILVSSELPEILGMSDRIAVMREGRLTGVVDRRDATQEVIMRYATMRV